MTSSIVNASAPTWSHGGPDSGGWASVLGNANGAGRPISLINSGSLGVNWPVIVLLPFSAAGGPQGAVNLTVFVEANPGPLVGGVPDPNAWADQSNGGFGMTTLVLTKLLNPALPYWRTRIASYVSGVLDSRIGPLQLSSGYFVNAGYPFKPAGGPVDFP